MTYGAIESDSADTVVEHGYELIFITSSKLLLLCPTN